jgi:hypothetical protein
MALVFAAAAGFVADSTALAAPAAFCAVAAGCWSLRVFEAPLRKPKTAGVDPRYPQFARLAYVWLVISAALGLAASRPGMLGASRHAFTVGFLTTLIFSIGPRILPAFLNSRELWSARVMRWSLVSITAGCVLRVTAEPLAYSGAAASAWKILPLSALFELSAVLLFALNLFMSLTTPIPAWIARKQINERLSVYWLVTSYPATRKLLVDNGLATLGNARAVPKSLTLGEAARADGVPADILVEKLGAFFDARLALSLRKQESEQCPS